MPAVSRRLFLLSLAVPFSAAGCGKGNNRLAVSGTVTWKGQPLPTGTVRFIPADAGPTTEATAVISDGAFSVPKDDGLLPGRYKVVVSSPDPRTQAGPPDAAPGDRGGYPAKDRLPEEYSTAGKTKLTADVREGQDNRFEFAVP